MFCGTLCGILNMVVWKISMFHNKQILKWSVFHVTILVYRSRTKLPSCMSQNDASPNPFASWFHVRGFWRFPNHTHFCHNEWRPCRVLGSTAISGGLCLLFRHFWWPPMKTKALGAFKWSEELGWIFHGVVITLNMVGSYPLNGYIHDTKVKWIQPKQKFGASYIMSSILGCHQLISKRMSKVPSWYVL